MQKIAASTFSEELESADAGRQAVTLYSPNSAGRVPKRQSSTPR